MGSVYEAAATCVINQGGREAQPAQTGRNLYVNNYKKRGCVKGAVDAKNIAPVLQTELSLKQAFLSHFYKMI